MPYVDIADKTTLDATKTVADRIETDTTSIESKVDTVDTVVDRIEVDTTSIESKVNTIDTVVDRIETDTTSIESKVDTIDTNVDDIEARLGLTNDTGGSTTAGTLMGKVNAVLAAGGNRKWSAKYTSVAIPSGANTTTIIDIVGYGQFWDIYQTGELKAAVGGFNIIIDGTTIYSNTTTTAIYPSYMLCRQGLAAKLSNYGSGAAPPATQVFPLQFKESLTITVTTSSAQAAATSHVHYDMWE